MLDPLQVSSTLLNLIVWHVHDIFYKGSIEVVLLNNESKGLEIHSIICERHVQVRVEVCDILSACDILSTMISVVKTAV